MNKKCTVYQTADFIGKKWTILILLEIYKGKKQWKRYSHIKNNLPKITPKILSSRLKELTKLKLVIKRINVETFPVKSEYSLTKKGNDFIKIIKDIKKWALKWNTRNKSCSSIDCKRCNL